MDPIEDIPAYGLWSLVVLNTAIFLQWPTVLTLMMFPFLVTMYVRLARPEERESLESFGEVYAAYMARTPAFIPQRLSPSQRLPQG